MCHDLAEFIREDLTVHNSVIIGKSQTSFFSQRLDRQGQTLQLETDRQIQEEIELQQQKEIKIKEEEEEFQELLRRELVSKRERALSIKAARKESQKVLMKITPTYSPSTSPIKDEASLSSVVKLGLLSKGICCLSFLSNHSK